VRTRYDTALAEYPLSALTNHARGLFLARQGDAAGAREAYRLLLELYPEWSGTGTFVTECRELGIELP